jgi:hypothetical protein
MDRGSTRTTSVCRSASAPNCPGHRVVWGSKRPPCHKTLGRAQPGHAPDSAHLDCLGQRERRQDRLGDVLAGYPSGSPEGSSTRAPHWRQREHHPERERFAHHPKRPSIRTNAPRLVPVCGSARRGGRFWSGPMAARREWEGFLFEAAQPLPLKFDPPLHRLNGSRHSPQAHPEPSRLPRPSTPNTRRRRWVRGPTSRDRRRPRVGRQWLRLDRRSPASARGQHALVRKQRPARRGHQGAGTRCWRRGC